MDDNSQCNATQRATAVRYYPLKSIKTIEPVRKLFPSCRYCTAQCWITARNNASVVIGPVQHNKKHVSFFDGPTIAMDVFPPASFACD